MSRTTDAFIDLMNLTGELASLCAEILKLHGYQVHDNIPFQSPTDLNVGDLIVRDPENRWITIEFKLYRSLRADRPLLLRAVNSVRRFMEGVNIERGLLIVTTPETAALSPEELMGGRIEIWNLSDLRSHAQQSPELSDALDEFIERASIGGFEGGQYAAAIDFGEASDRQASQVGTGGEIADQLEKCPPSREGAIAFKKCCTDAIKPLFGREFRNLRSQFSNKDGFHRFDLVGRLVPRHEFWVALAADFRTRYIVFEFKNYAGTIGQDQIYSTEKYLFPTALRSIAFIIARKHVHLDHVVERRSCCRQRSLQVAERAPRLSLEVGRPVTLQVMRPLPGHPHDRAGLADPHHLAEADRL